MMANRIIKLTAEGKTEKKEEITSQSGRALESVTGSALKKILIQKAKITTGTKKSVAG
jgi:hypothetical protein